MPLLPENVLDEPMQDYCHGASNMKVAILSGKGHRENTAIGKFGCGSYRINIY